MKTYWGVEVKLQTFLTSSLDGGEWSALRLGRFTPSTHWMEGCVGPRTGLDTGEEKNSQINMTNLPKQLKLDKAQYMF
jgi:hypothetical protein